MVMVEGGCDGDGGGCLHGAVGGDGGCWGALWTGGWV